MLSAVAWRRGVDPAATLLFRFGGDVLRFAPAGRLELFLVGVMIGH